MAAISTAEVERFRDHDFRSSILEAINTKLRSKEPGVTVEISEAELEAAVVNDVGLSVQEEMVGITQLYRAVGWRVIRGSLVAGQSNTSWLFNARSFSFLN